MGKDHPLPLPFRANQMGNKRVFFASGAAGTVNSATSKPARWRRRVRFATGREPAMANSPPACKAS